MSIGDRIKKRRQELGWTQSRLAEVLGVTPQHVSIVEQDKRAPSLSSLARLAEELGVTIDFLVTGKETSITDSIPAIKADKKLSLDSKNSLITLVGQLHKLNDLEK
ncbi:MAG: helix-turn-helix transcriptional regulator [Dehalococcoidia bacterium]|nr:helix-turn-helix transcriptional regulator [Dehalococcoidia bacterium]